MSDGPAPARASWLDRALVAIGVAPWLVLGAMWVLAVAQRPLADDLTRSAAAIGIALSFAAFAVRLARAVRPGAPDPISARLILALVVLAMVVRWVGLDHELAGAEYADEGIYRKRAAEVMNGQPFPTIFIYPHLFAYTGAFSNWLISRSPDATLIVTRGLYDVEQWNLVVRLLFRALVATLGALTVWPVFRIGQRVSGRLAGTLGALLITFSPLYNGGSKLSICDIPSAFFATLTVAFVARLVDRERTGDYALAGIAAGLAAGSKYPAGVVAIAIVAIWLYWRIETRRWSWSLAVAGATAIATFLATTPGLLVYPTIAWTGKKGLFFGTTQYRGGGWVGVVPQSNLVYYTKAIAADLGLPALILAAGGIFTLGRATWRRLLLILPHPLVYLGLIVTSSMVVLRNLWPALPTIAAIVAVAATGPLVFLAQRRVRGLGLATAALFAVALLLPLKATVEQDIAHARPSTRELALAWVLEHVPPSAAVLKEYYTPDLPRRVYSLRHERFAPRVPLTEVRTAGYDFVIVADHAYRRWLEQERTDWEELESMDREVPHREEYRRWYETVFREFELVEEFSPSRTRLGPGLRIYRVAPLDPELRTERTFAPADFHVPDRDVNADYVYWARDGQWRAIRDRFVAGRYRLELQGQVTPGSRARVVDQDNVTLAEADLDDGPLEVTFAGPGRYFFFLHLAPESVVRSATVRAVTD